jgi:hypothetical protein
MTKVYVYHLFEGTTEVAQFESDRWLNDYEIKKRKWRYEKNSKQSLRWVVEERKLTFDEVLGMREDSLGQEPIEYTEEQIKILEYYYEQHKKENSYEQD